MEILELRQIVSALIGAALALLGQSLTRRGLKARTARRLCVAFWEELSATQFYALDANPSFGGFSSQTFDSLFRELAVTLPDLLARDLMRYHWRMKYLEDMRQRQRWSVSREFWLEAKELHQRLCQRLELYSQRSLPAVFLRNSETSPSRLLQP